MNFGCKALTCLFALSLSANVLANPVGKKDPDVSNEVSAAVHDANGKLVLGELEWVKVGDVDVVVKARVDTGATTSSISAIEVTPFERDGAEWVKFHLAHEEGESKEFSLPVVRTVRIIQSSAEGYDKRFVVEMPITLGDVTESTEFTLRDRLHLNYPVLLGRSYMRDIGIVDVSKKFVQPKPVGKNIDE